MTAYSLIYQGHHEWHMFNSIEPNLNVVLRYSKSQFYSNFIGSDAMWNSKYILYSVRGDIFNVEFPVLQNLWYVIQLIEQGAGHTRFDEG